MENQSDEEKSVYSTPSPGEVDGQASNLELEHDYPDGYILDASQLGQNSSTKLARDGRTVLIPQPSNDPNDPLNWSQTKKNIVLAIVCACTFLPDYGSVTGAITLQPQAL